MKWLNINLVLSILFYETSWATCPMNLGPPPQLKFGITCTVAPTSCDNYTQYRTFDGTCNNLEHPIRGAATYLYSRFAPPNYGDGISSFPVSSSGKPLPNARELSLRIFSNQSKPDPRHALGFMSFGQLVAHDLGMQMDKSEFFGFCCDNGQYKYCNGNVSECATIDVLPNDAVYPSDISCINFVRSIDDRDLNCDRNSSHPELLPIEQVTGVSSFADLSIVYGSTAHNNYLIRQFSDGLLVVDQRYGIDWPLQDPGFSTCLNTGESCFHFADARANQNPGLTLFHIYFYQEHNRLATLLKSVNPQWDDERLFQEARRINIAQYQQIVYYEYLPLLIGKDLLLNNRIIYEGNLTYIDDYDSTVDPGSINEFSNGAFRFFHSQIEGHLELINSDLNSTGSVRLSDFLTRPKLLDDDGAINYELLGRGLGVQPQQSTDMNFDPEIKDFLFRFGHEFGQDLRSIDITRGRDHGLATYNEVRQRCGLSRTRAWKCLEKHIPKDRVKILRRLYASPDDVELVIGGALEEPIKDSLVGPTFTCIIVNEFQRIRYGDRFFFENHNSPFNLEQMAEIKKATIADIYCNHVKNLGSVQQRAFELINITNPLVDCSSIPTLNISYWMEH